MSFGGLSFALSIVFGCLMLALIAQLYYFLWWRKKRTRAEIEIDQGNYAATKGMFSFGFWKIPCSSLHSANTTGNVTRDTETKNHEPDLELGAAGKDLLLKSYGEEGVESELMRLHNLAGPPRFLFTIKEETKEDLESEDRSRKGSRTRSLSDIMLAIDTPFLTPVASSPLKCSLDPLESYKHQGFNPLFESSAESDFNRFRSSSPPPKFKFLRDAEEKLYKRLIEEAQRKAQKNHGCVTEYVVKDSSNATMTTEERNGSFLKFLENKEKEQKTLQQNLPHFPSSSSQVLPLSSSPTTFIPLEKASSMVH